MLKSPEHKLLELQQKVRLLEKQIAILEKQVERPDKNSVIFDMMLDLAEKEYNISILKKTQHPNKRSLFRKIPKKLNCYLEKMRCPYVRATSRL